MFAALLPNIYRQVDTVSPSDPPRPGGGRYFPSPRGTRGRPILPKVITIIGLSNLIGDIVECAHLCGYRSFVLFANVPMAVRERTLGIEARLHGFPSECGVTMAADWSQVPAAAASDFALGTSAIGRDRLLAEARQRLGAPFATLVHPDATVSGSATLGEAVFVGAGSVLASNVRLAEGVFVNRAASIGHDTRIGPFCRIQPGAHIAGHVALGAHVSVGMGACILHELRIGDGAEIAAGTIVARDLPAGARIAGGRAILRRAAADPETI